jgi:hypothetical protein
VVVGTRRTNLGCLDNLLFDTQRYSPNLFSVKLYCVLRSIIAFIVVRVFERSKSAAVEVVAGITDVAFGRTGWPPFI